MALTVFPAKVQPPTMPIGPWEVNTQCAQATGLAGLLDIERTRLWWRGRWFPLTTAGRSNRTSLPVVGGSATNVTATDGWLYTASAALPTPIGVNTPLTVHSWCSSSVSTALDKQVISLANGGAGTRQVSFLMGDTGTPGNTFVVSAKTAGASTFTKRISTLTPLENTVYAFTGIARIDTFPDIYINGALNNGAGLLDNGGARITPIDTLFFGAQNAAGGVPLTGPLGYCAIWEGILSAADIYSLWDPDTRWDLLWQKKNIYFDLSAPAIQDTPPSQYARPKYITLNEFSPQARGLVAWVPSVQGEFVQAQCPSSSTILNTFDGDSTNIPNRVVPQVDPAGVDVALSPGDRKPSDFGMVPMSTKDMNPVGNTRAVYAFMPEIDVSGLNDATFVYWVYPLPQVFQEAGYWSWTSSNTQGMTNTKVALGTSPAQVLTFSNGDPHRRGRWQMITVARTLGQVTVWRDLQIVESGAVAGGPLTSLATDNVMLIGAVYDTSRSQQDGVNALWADFRVYNRAWTQTDVTYAYNAKTRWDYYWQPRDTPYQDFPFIPPPSTTFLSRLSTLGAG